MRLENEPKTRRCDLYEGQEYAVSQWGAIPANWVKLMGATYMRVRPISEDIRYPEKATLRNWCGLVLCSGPPIACLTVPWLNSYGETV